MKRSSIILATLLGLQPVIAEESINENLAQRIEVLEKGLATLSAQVAASNTGCKKDVPKEPVAQPEIIVDVLADGRLRVEGKILSSDDFLGKIKSIATQFPNQPVRIRKDDQTNYQNVVQAVELCQHAGARNISFATTNAQVEQGAAAQVVTKERSLWLYDAGWFEMKNEKKWIEMNRNIYADIGRHVEFKEVNSSDAYVGLYDVQRKMTVRLSNSQMEWRKDGEEGWNKLYEGHWSK